MHCQQTPQGRPWRCLHTGGDPEGRAMGEREGGPWIGIEERQERVFSEGQSPAPSPEAEVLNTGPHSSVLSLMNPQGEAACHRKAGEDALKWTAWNSPQPIAGILLSPPLALGPQSLKKHTGKGRYKGQAEGAACLCPGVRSPAACQRHHWSLDLEEGAPGSHLSLCLSPEFMCHLPGMSAVLCIQPGSCVYV